MHRTSRLQNSMKLQQKTGESEVRPKILFVCVHNAGRSRMAAAFLEELAGNRYHAISAGTQPAKRPHPEVVEAMKEVGVQLDPGPGTLLTQEMADEAARVIGMGCNVEEACPALSVPLEDWKLDDPKGQPPEDVAFIRDQIEMRVRNLVAQLDRERNPRADH